MPLAYPYEKRGGLYYCDVRSTDKKVILDSEGFDKLNKIPRLCFIVAPKKESGRKIVGKLVAVSVEKTRTPVNKIKPFKIEDLLLKTNDRLILRGKGWIRYKIKHLDGDVYNNTIKNLSLLGEKRKGRLVEEVESLNYLSKRRFF